jgi:hypothetical protein
MAAGVHQQIERQGRHAAKLLSELIVRRFGEPGRIEIARRWLCDNAIAFPRLRSAFIERSFAPRRGSRGARHHIQPQMVEKAV